MQGAGQHVRIRILPRCAVNASPGFHSFVLQGTRERLVAHPWTSPNRPSQGKDGGGPGSPTWWMDAGSISTSPSDQSMTLNDRRRLSYWDFHMRTEGWREH